MGLLDRPEIVGFASVAYERIGSAEAETGLNLSPFARELIAVWAVSLAYEPTSPESVVLEAELSPQPGREEVFEQLLNLLPSALDDMRNQPGVFTRAPQMVRSVDVFHWLADRGNAVVAQSLFCPFEK